VIDVRPARPEEFERIGALTLHAYESAGILGTDPRYRVTLTEAHARALDNELIAAVLGGHVAGTATFCPYGSPHAEISGPDEAEFRMLAVDPAFEGQGVGRALIAYCEDRARSLGLHRLVLSVIAHNDKAARLYDRLGFVRAEHRDWRPVPDVHLLVWEKAL
jgi:ribosomal protein S18 acetylase RimI-like enzyme